MSSVTQCPYHAQVMFQAGQVEIKYSPAFLKRLRPDQTEILTEKLSAAYRIFFKSLSNKERKGIKEVDFLFQADNKVKALVIKAHDKPKSYSIDTKAKTHETLRNLEHDIVHIVDQVRQQTLRPKQVLDVQVINQGDHVAVTYSKKLSKENEAIILKKVMQIFKSFISKASKIDAIDFSFNQGHHLEINVISGGKKTFYEGDALLAEASEGINEKKLFEAIDSIGKNSLRPLATSLNPFQKFVRFVQNTISFRVIVQPLVQKKIRQMIAQQHNAENLKNIYKDPQVLAKGIKDAILATTAAHTFSENEIGDFIQNELMQGIQTRLKELKLPHWDKETISQLNAQRIIHYLTTHPDEANSQLFTELQSLSVLDIQIDELGKIPITPQNQDNLAQTWRYLIETTFREGKLNQLASKAKISEGITQAQYASTYSNLNHYLPDQLRNIFIDSTGDTLKDYCDQLEIKQPIKKLHNFVIQRSNAGINAPTLGEAGAFYKEYIAPVLADMELNTISLSLLGDSLALKNSTLINNFLTKVRRKEGDSELEMPTFDDQWLQAVLYNELEMIAVKKYHLLTPQLKMLRTLRNDSENQQVQLEGIQSGIKKYQFEEFFIEKAKQFLVQKKELSEISIQLTEKEARLAFLWDLTEKEMPITEVEEEEREALSEETIDLETQKDDLEERLNKLAKSSSESPWLKELRNRKDIDPIDFEREIENRRGYIKDQFGEWSQQFFKNPHSIEALKNLTIQAEGLELEEVENLWKQVLTQEFEKVDLNHLSPHTRIENLKEEFKDFILAKTYFRSFLSKPIDKTPQQQDLVRKVSQVIDELEIRIVQPHIKKYLDQAATPANLDTNEFLYGDEVIKAVVAEKSHYSKLTSEQQANLMHLNKVFLKAQKKQPLTIEDQMEVTKTLESLRKDAALSKLIKQLDVEGVEHTFLNYMPKSLHGFIKRRILKEVESKESLKIFGGVDQNTMKFLKNYLARAKNIGELQIVERLNTKAENLLIKMEHSALADTIQNEDRLNLRELGILSRSERLKDGNFVNHLEALGVLEFDADLKKWVENHKKTVEIFEKLTTDVLQPAIDEHYKDGCVLAHSTKRKAAWSGKPVSVEERAIAWVSNGFTHGAKLFHNKEGHVSLSHVQGEYEQDPLNLFELSASEIWEIDVAPLVDFSLSAELETVYGEDWKNHINKMYQQIEKKLHQSGMQKFKKIENNEERRIKAGLANRPWVYRLFGQIGLKGHKTSLKRDLNKIHQNFLQEQPLKEKQICSEFVSKATLASMLELNRKIAQDIREHHGIKGETLVEEISKTGIPLEEDVKEYGNGKRYYKKEASRTEKAEQGFRKALKVLGKPEKEIALIIRLGNHAILDLPYKDERMHAIHPGRMVTILTDKKCAKLLPPPPKLAQIINFDPAAAKLKKK